MQEFKFSVTGAQRKELVTAISEILNTPTNYLGAPSFSYEIGDYTVDKEGTVSGKYKLGLFTGLEQKGFTYEVPETYYLITPNGESEHGKHFAVVGVPFEVEETTTQEALPERLTIEIPIEGFTQDSIENLHKMVKAIEYLLMAALGVNDLPIQVLEDRICFPWFLLTEDSKRTNAYAQLISALCKTAKEKKRVTVKAQDGFENEKFTMRIWLIGLGCVGAEYKYLRKIMGEFLGGNSAFRYGKPEKEALESEVAIDE